MSREARLNRTIRRAVERRLGKEQGGKKPSRVRLFIYGVRVSCAPRGVTYVEPGHPKHSITLNQEGPDEGATGGFFTSPDMVADKLLPDSKVHFPCPIGSVADAVPQDWIVSAQILSSLWSPTTPASAFYHSSSLEPLWFSARFKRSISFVRSSTKMKLGRYHPSLFVVVQRQTSGVSPSSNGPSSERSMKYRATSSRSPGLFPVQRHNPW